MTMDIAMPKDYLPQLLTTMQEQLVRIEAKTDDQSKTIGVIQVQTSSMSKDIKQAQKDISKLEVSKGKRSGIEPRTLYMLALAFVIVLAIVATLMGVRVGGLI
jgi:hypothetical protein